MKKYQIFRMEEDESWALIEECLDDLVLADRLIMLRQDGKTYRAEQREGSFSLVLDQ